MTVEHSMLTMIASGKYSIKVSMDGFNEDGQMKKFHDMLLSMDKKIMESGIENSYHGSRRGLYLKILLRNYITVW